jgi:hypothetical protein
MRGANLGYARLDGARLLEAQLQGAELQNVHLEGADMIRANLQGASLISAHLQGATLSFALLQGSDMFGAELQSAFFINARLQGASLEAAQLEGADFHRAQLQGANLKSTQLQGAVLGEAELQGADLTESGLADSEFYETLVFRTDITGAAKPLTASISSVRADQVRFRDTFANSPLPPRPVDFVPLKEVDVQDWVDSATRFGTDFLQLDKETVTGRFARLKQDFQTREKDAQDQADWQELQKQALALDPDQHRRRLATILVNLACQPDGAPYVARALIGSSVSLAPFGHLPRFASLGDQLAGVLKRMMAARDRSDSCQGVAGFTDRDWRQLEAINPN